MSLDNIFAQIKAKASEMKTDVLKFKNKNFLNAAMAGAALMSLADKTITSDEKQKMLKFIQANDALSIFPQSDVINVFQNFINQLEFDYDSGEAVAFAALRDMSSNDQAARLIMRMILAIAAADGQVDECEEKMAERIARELSVSLADFE